MMRASIDSVETFGLVDGPGIRTVVFFSGCNLRCKYCHNPEMFKLKEYNYSTEELVNKILQNRPYFKRNNGGVTFSGGEPLLQIDFLIDMCQRLKEENVHIAIDTAGVGIGKYPEILKLVDLIIFDVKHVFPDEYKTLTGRSIDESEKFIESLNESGKDVWIRQVIVPGLMDNENYLEGLAKYLKKIKNIKKIEFLPFHHLGFNKYKNLGIVNYLENVPEMASDKCEALYQDFIEKYENMIR